jgi:hypothetical protein
MPTAGAAISMYGGGAPRCGDPAGAIERYQEAAATMTRSGLARAAAGVGPFGRFAMLVTQGRAAEMLAESAYQNVLPYAGQPAGADNTVLTLGPAAQIPGDIACRFSRPGAGAL